MSLLETTKKEGTPVSGVQTISGHGFATSNLPKRPWSAYNTTSLRKGNADSTPPTTRVIRSPKSRTTPLGVSAEASQPRARTQSTNSSDAMDPAVVASSKAESTEKEQEGLQEFLSMLAAKQSNWTEDKVSDDTIDNRIDSLIEMMKAHHISEPTNPIPVNGNRETSQSTPSSIPLTAPTFDFTFDSKSFVNGKAKLKDSKGGSSLKEQVTHLSATNLPNNQEIQPTSSSKSTKPAKPTQKTSTMPTSDFQFSFNATTPLRDNAKFTTSDISRPPAAQHDGFSAPRLLRRMSDVQSMYTSHPMHQALYHVPILEDSTKVSTKTEQTEFGDEEDYGSDEGDNNEKQAGLPSMEGDKATHNEHRRILPLPKPRSKRKASKQVQSAAATYMANLSTSDATDTIVSASRQISAFAPFLSQISTSRDNRQQSTAKSSDTALPDGDWGISQLSLSDDTLSLGNANTMTAFGNKNTLLEHEIHYAGESSDASYRDNAKKMKRSAGGDGRSSSVHTTDVAAVRRKDRKWRTITEDRGMLASVEVSGSRFPERSFHFAMDARTREKLKQLPKMEDLPRSAPALNLSSVLRQTLSSIQSRQPAAISTARQVRQRKGDLFGTANTLLRNEPPFPAGGTAKKKGKVTSTVSDATATVRTDRPGAPAGNSASSSLHTGRRNKKSNRKKKGDEDSGQSNNVSSSDIAVVRSPDPDEWICVFCQYEIFCRGLEAARRKGGYYRRRRERARRLREAEARRAGEPLSGVASDVEDDRAADDHQSFLAPGAPTMGTIPSMGPPLADQQQRPLRRGNRAA